MSMVKWNPWHDIEEVFDHYNRLPVRGRGHESMATGDWLPKVDISETDKEFLIKAEIPEVKKKMLRLQWTKAL